MISQTAPIVIAESATLKAGHILKSMKSTTKPRKILSIKLPTAPPRIKAIGIFILFSFIILSMWKRIAPMIAMEIKISIRFIPLNIPNPPPVFWM